MFNIDELITEINQIIKINYPLKCKLVKFNPKYIIHNEVFSLSHFNINNIYENLYFPFTFDINGIILDSQYKSYQIIKVNNFTWKKYIYLLLSFSTNKINPYISPFFLINLHKKNKIDIFCIHTIIIFNKLDLTQTKLIIEYQNKQLIKFTNKLYTIPTNTGNHFYFPSFNIDTNQEQIRNELTKLLTLRDTYDSIHIHLENNSGGSVVPGELLLKCLIGTNRESWMKNVKK